MHDLLHGALHFEGKLWRTLPMLAIRPGQLTRRYIEGARARFVSPMALFLFSVFLMFAVFQVMGATTPTSGDAERSFEEGLVDGLAEEPSPTEPGPAEAPIEEAGGVRVSTAYPAAERFVDETFEKWRKNPELMLYKLQANSYKFSWLLIPLSIPFVWLLFAWKRRFKAYDHAIFVTYSLAFMSMLFIAVSVMEAAGLPSVLQLILLLVPPIHLYKQLRGAYELSRFSAFWRLMVLSLFIWLVIALFLQLLLLLGAF